jgi:signal transduction histidine kinase
MCSKGRIAMRFGQSAFTSGRKFSGRLSLLALLFISSVSPVLGAESPKRVLLLEGLTDSESSAQRTAEAMTLRFNERSSEDIEIYSDNLDLGRFRGRANENRLMQYLHARFAKVRPDVIVPTSRAAVSFMARHRDKFPRNVPITYCCAPTFGMDTPDVPPEIPGVVVAVDWPGTLALAERLQPHAKTVVIVTGASERDRRRKQEMIRVLRPYLQKYEIRYLSGLPYNELLKQVSHLPRNSIVLLERIFEDGSGLSHGTEFANDLSRASAAPIYSALSIYLGSGILGGHMENFKERWTKVADLVLDILDGKDPSTLPHQIKLPIQYYVDARQFERWGFLQASLPPGTSLEFRRPSLWAQHKNAVILAFLAFAMLVGFIALLLIEIRKRQQAEEARRTAEAETELRRNEVTHLMRVGIVSELSGGIAHELGQPLAAILANAQAAQRLVATNRHDRNEIVEILDDIVEENRHAGDVIHRLRGLLKKEEHKAGLINLNDQINSTLRLVHSELVSRRITLWTDLDAHLRPIIGDRVQLQQVFLNLIMNAMDAMASVPASERTLSISTRSRESGNVEVSITDRGPGMSPDQLKSVFEPFFTTKEHGLGLGLAICWRIIRSHNGKLTISNAGGGGVRAVLSLPVAIRLAAAS